MIPFLALLTATLYLTLRIRGRSGTMTAFYLPAVAVPNVLDR